MRLFIVTLFLALAICCLPLSARGDSGGQQIPALQAVPGSGYPGGWNPGNYYPFYYNAYGFPPYSFTPYYNPYFPAGGANPYGYGPHFIPPSGTPFGPVSSDGDMIPAPEAQPAAEAKEGPSPKGGYSDLNLTFPTESQRFPHN
jgi:hypothetical protein